MTTKTFIQKICCRYVVLNLIAMAVVCTALVYAAMFCADIYTHHGEAIAVPDIRNKKFADAERLLEDACCRPTASCNRHPHREWR